MLNIKFTPKVISPDFSNQENIDWIDSYLKNHSNVPKYFWKSRFCYEQNKDINVPDIIQIRNNVNHRLFSKSFLSKWDRLKSINIAPECKIELKYVPYKINPTFEQKVIEIDIIPYTKDVKISSYFSITLHPEQKICLIDDFFPEIYIHGWGGISRVILQNLEIYLKQNLPFVINNIYVCSIPETYIFWKKMGFVCAPKNEWGSHIKLLK